jgi:hypothetical protein
MVALCHSILEGRCGVGLVDEGLATLVELGQGDVSLEIDWDVKSDVCFGIGCLSNKICAHNEEKVCNTVH